MCAGEIRFTQYYTRQAHITHKRMRYVYMMYKLLRYADIQQKNVCKSLKYKEFFDIGVILVLR